MKKLIVGNWKMNPATLEQAREVASATRRVAAELEHTDVVICPPHVFISDCTPRTSSAHSYLGAQSVSPNEGGPHTGEVSVLMLKDLGVEYVIAGHSEERARGADDAEISRTAAAITNAGLTAIVCVGEKVRDEGGAYLEFIKEQIHKSLADVTPKRAKDIVLAYEPIWAIGATAAMNPEQVCEMSLFVRKVFSDLFGQDMAMKIQVLYGGSVNATNAADIIRIGNVDGLLVGRESVNIEGFRELLRAVDKI